VALRLGVPLRENNDSSRGFSVAWPRYRKELCASEIVYGIGGVNRTGPGQNILIQIEITDRWQVIKPITIRHYFARMSTKELSRIVPVTVFANEVGPPFERTYISVFVALGKMDLSGADKSGVHG
jgi:hypothetical protein